MPWTRGSLLGEGGYGRVYECLNDDGRIWAAKVVLSLSLCVSASPLSVSGSLLTVKRYQVVPLRPGDDERSRLAQAEIEKEIEVFVLCSIHARRTAGVPDARQT